MKKLVKLFNLTITFLILISLINAAEVDVLGIDITYSGENFELNQLIYKTGVPTQSDENGSYILRTIDGNENILDEILFSIPVLELSPDPQWFDNETGEQIIVPEKIIEKIQLFFFINYDESAKFVIVNDLITGEEKLRIDIKKQVEDVSDFYEKNYPQMYDDQKSFNWILYSGVLILIILMVFGIYRFRRNQK